MTVAQEKPECPNLRVQVAGDEAYYWCLLNDHSCLIKYSEVECEEYEDFLKESE